ncbi:MAG: ABC transporter ATP-binding protein [Gaiellaceae bacterium]
MTAPAAELRDVHKSFPGVKALAGVSLQVEPGEILALLGPNGAGKTTAIRLLLGLRRPDGGTARLSGLDPRRAEARRSCGVTPQETDLPETLRVAEILEFVRAHYPRPVPTRELLERFGLLELACRQAGGLSGGQRRRLAVALAFAGDPVAVFLDEPSSGLDLPTRRRLWDAVRGFAARGRAILLTTHDLAEAEALASRIVVLAHGRVVLEGSVAEIATRAGLQRIRIRSQPLPPLRGVERVVENGRFLDLLVRSSGEALRALAAAEADLDEIEVAPAGLEHILAPEAGS